MKKNISLPAVGIMISLAIISGCSLSGRSVGEAEAAIESTAAVEPETSEPAGEDTTEKTEGFVSNEDFDSEDHRDEKAAPVRIWGVITGIEEDSIIVDNQSDVSSLGEIVLMIDPDSTYLLDGRNGFPVSLDEVQTGSFYACLGPMMTMSLPPQTVPYAVIVNIPEDASAPLYVIADGPVAEKDNTKVLTTNDGTEYPIEEDARVQPFLTKNIVQMDDIRKGSECLLWMNTDGMVERIVLLSK
ncbi:MAG: hypothetical protein LUD07_10560 [Clostridiales bacterium]|nr:hypothetical protein [Clostridiales bacterium]